MKSSRQIIGSIIKQQRKKKGLTMQDLADKLETERQYVWMMENGKKNISADYLDKIIAKLGCSPLDFFNIPDNS